MSLPMIDDTNLPNPLLRVSKIVAIERHNADRYTAYLDGGHEMQIAPGTAAYLTMLIIAANRSDESFFSRDG